MIRHVLEDGFGLVELALTLEIQSEVVQHIHQAVIQRHFAELVEGHVKLTLPLERQAQHAIALCGIGIGFELALFRHQETFRREQQVADQQQCCGQHQLQPHRLGRHQDEMDRQQQYEQAARDSRGQSGTQARHQQNQVQ